MSIEIPHKTNILIIDDEKEICILLSYALQKLGYATNYSLTLKEGSQKLSELQPDVVLLDIHLPDGSGFNIIPEITALGASFLVISAYDDGKEFALQNGAARFFKKPFDLQKIASAISDITNGSA